LILWRILRSSTKNSVIIPLRIKTKRDAKYRVSTNVLHVIAFISLPKTYRLIVFYMSARALIQLMGMLADLVNRDNVVFP
jgi:hypothetical protein